MPCGEHVYLINHIHFVFANMWRDAHLIYQTADIIYRVVGSSIQLMHIERVGFIERNTGFAFVAGFNILCEFSQLMVLAMIRAQVVLPTPLGPQKRNACARWLFLMAFLRVLVMEACPTTISKVAGRYLRADTIKFSM
jgi:hypothetical protein